MKITIRPVVDPGREIDVTHRVVAAVAEALWMECGGNSVLNWIEAERHLKRIVCGGGLALVSEADPRPSAATVQGTGRMSRKRLITGVRDAHRSGRNRKITVAVGNFKASKEAQRSTARKQA